MSDTPMLTTMLAPWDNILNDAAYLKMINPRWRSIYPAPYFDPICLQIIQDPKILIQWSRFFYEWHPIVHAAINKMATYPITDFVFETEDPNVRKNYEKAFDILDVRNTLIKAGLDYYVSGISMLSMIMPFKRMLQCPECGNAVAIDYAKSFRVATANSFTFHCPTCDGMVNPTFYDIPTQDLERMRIIHWNPLDMSIDYDDILGSCEFEYSLPSYLKEGFLKGDPRYVGQYPTYFMEAAKQNKMLRLFPDKVIHTRRVTHSSAFYKGWGQPIITPVLKNLFHLLVMIRAQDALAIDQIIPWTVLSPAPQGGTDPASDMDLTGWMQQVIHEYECYQKEPTRKSVMPVPLNVQLVGGQAKNLMMVPEIQEVTNQILAGMGVPNEFVYGGLQWSGASVSLRMLENQFINYRAMMQHIIDAIVDQIATFFGYPPIPVKMQSFKMADDVAQKDLLLKMAQAGLISNRTLLSELLPNLDYDQELDQLSEESLQKVKIQADTKRAMVAAGLAMPDMVPDNANPNDQGDGGGEEDQGQHGDLPEHNPPRSEGKNKQI